MKKKRGVTVTVRRQRRIDGGRLHGSTGFDPRVWSALQKESARFGVSIPFVLSVMAADTLGVPLPEEDRYVRRLRLAAGGRG